MNEAASFDFIEVVVQIATMVRIVVVAAMVKIASTVVVYTVVESLPSKTTSVVFVWHGDLLPSQSMCRALIYQCESDLKFISIRVSKLRGISKF